MHEQYMAQCDGFTAKNYDPKAWLDLIKESGARYTVLTTKHKLGNCMPLYHIPVGTQVHNIELYPGKGGQLVRSAGNGAQLMAKEGKYATLRLPSGEMRMVPIICRATIGVSVFRFLELNG